MKLFLEKDSVVDIRLGSKCTYEDYHIVKNQRIQKQPLAGVLRKSCPESMQQIYRRTPMPKCDFNKVALQL